MMWLLYLYFIREALADSYALIRDSIAWMFGAKHAAAFLSAHLRKDLPRRSAAVDAAGNAVLRTDPRSIYH